MLLICCAKHSVDQHCMLVSSLSQVFNLLLHRLTCLYDVDEVHAHDITHQRFIQKIFLVVLFILALARLTRDLPHFITYVVFLQPPPKFLCSLVSIKHPSNNKLQSEVMYLTVVHVQSQYLASSWKQRNLE